MALKSGHSLSSIGLLTDIDTAQRNELGARCQDKAGNEYIYLQGIGSTAAGDWVFYHETYVTSRTVNNTAASGPMAVALAAVLASQFGWYQVWGLVAVANIATDAAADGKTLSNGNSAAGRLVTGPTTTKNVFGAVAVGASANNLGAAFITYPFSFGTATI